MIAALARLTQSSTQPDTDARKLSFSELYRQYFDFVWRSARSLGARPGAVDDVVQEVFFIVHTRINEFTWGTSMRPWISKIVVNVVRHHRRTLARKSPHDSDVHEHRDPDTVAHGAADPYERATLSESGRLLQRLLDALDEEKREVMVLADIEQLSVPEIAEIVGINVNTAYSRLRLGREAFNEGLARHRAEDKRMRR